MKVYEFPATYKEALDQRTAQKIRDEESRSIDLQNSIRQQPGKKPDGSSYTIGVGFVGFVIGFFICCNNGNSPDGTVGSTLGTWLLCTIIGLIIGAIIFSSVSKSYDESVNAANRSAEREKEQSVHNKEKIQADAEKEYRDYIAQFEAAAQSMSVQFAESQLAVEVIEWMTQGFAKAIDATDRRSHVERIDVPFMFQVYSNKITCNLGTFDFEIKRCRNLESPLEQTALSRAIAAAVQLNITMKYPKDASGTDIITNINYEYGADYVKTTVVYSAVNGNYRAVRDWSN